MLERQSYQDLRADEDHGQTLTLSYFYGILKRRFFYFIIPFVLILVIGSLVVAAWPARYLSSGTLLVEAQEIPSDLVRPTVGRLANDRIQVIEQRVMTRDNLVSIARKFALTTSWQAQMSGTEIVDFIRSRTEIKPAELKLQGQRKDAIAFTVGFEYEQPQMAAKVANELMTMILKEDARSRTEAASETTKFLFEDVKRLEAQVGLLDDQISKLHQSGVSTQSDKAQALAALKAELVLKSATYSDAHPDILVLKRRIKLLEQNAPPPTAKVPLSQDTAPSADASAPGIDSLETKRASLREELNKATQKLSAARLGESLERGQHSERLEVIEQPTLPQKPVSPNRPKLMGFVFIIAAMAGGGLAFAGELLSQSIYRSSDLFSLVDGHLVVSIPYISTQSELKRKKIKFIVVTGILAALVLGGLTVLFFILPPLDILFTKVVATLFR